MHSLMKKKLIYLMITFAVFQISTNPESNIAIPNFGKRTDGVLPDIRLLPSEVVNVYASLK